MAGLIGAVLAYFAMRPTVTASRRAFLILMVFGLALWICPAAIISLSRAVQVRADQTLGNGYLNVYLESAGVAIIGGTLVVRYLEAIQTKDFLYAASRIALAVLFGLLVELTGTTNRTSILPFSPIWTTTRTEIDRAFASGLMSPFVQNTANGKVIVYWDAPYPIPAGAVPSLIYADSHEALNAEFVESARFQPRLNASTWILEVAPDSGRIAVVRVAAINRVSDGQITPISDHWFVTGRRIDATYRQRFESKILSSRGPEPIYEVSDCIGASTADVISDLPPSNFSFVGFGDQEVSANEAWRWGRARSVMHIAKLVPARALVEVHMLMQTLGTSRGDQRARENDHSSDEALSGNARIDSHRYAKHRSRRDSVHSRRR